MSLTTKLHELIELPFPDEVKEAIEELLKEQGVREELIRMGILGFMKSRGGEIRLVESSKVDYETVVNELISLAKDEMGDHILTIYAVGSYARGDLLPGRSNIDFFVIVKPSKMEKIVKISELLNHYAEQLGKKYLGDVEHTLKKCALGIYIASLEDLKTFYVEDAWEYHLLMREAKLLYGEDVRSCIKKPDSQKGNQIAQDALKCFHEKVQSKDFTNVNLLPLLFGLTFKSLALHLSTIGVYVGGKQDILREFKRLYPDEKKAIKSVERAYALWVVWGERDLVEHEISELRGFTIKIQETIKYLAKSSN